MTTRIQSSSRISALAKAEWLQFRRNKTLLFMAVVFPLGLPLVMFNLGDRGAVESANTFDIFVLYALLFVQFYTVLSMVTTRRDERVLKRLRTGEARDWEIIAALCAPGVLLTVVFSIIIIPVLLMMGAPAPVNLIPIVLAVILGLILVSALALATSGFTRNAESAQLTSLPVLTFAFLGMGALRPLFGDGVLADIVNYTPFAKISDLVQLGWSGTTYSETLAGATVLDFGGVLAASIQPLLVLLVWIVVTVLASGKWMRWDTHR